MISFFPESDFRDKANDQSWIDSDLDLGLISVFLVFFHLLLVARPRVISKLG